MPRSRARLTTSAPCGLVLAGAEAGQGPHAAGLYGALRASASSKAYGVHREPRPVLGDETRRWPTVPARSAGLSPADGISPRSGAGHRGGRQAFRAPGPNVMLGYLPRGRIRACWEKLPDGWHDTGDNRHESTPRASSPSRGRAKALRQDSRGEMVSLSRRSRPWRAALLAAGRHRWRSPSPTSARGERHRAAHDAEGCRSRAPCSGRPRPTGAFRTRPSPRLFHVVDKIPAARHRQDRLCLQARPAAWPRKLQARRRRKWA